MEVGEVSRRREFGEAREPQCENFPPSGAAAPLGTRGANLAQFQASGRSRRRSQSPVRASQPVDLAAHSPRSGPHRRRPRSFPGPLRRRGGFATAARGRPCRDSLSADFDLPAIFGSSKGFTGIVWSFKFPSSDPISRKKMSPERRDGGRGERGDIRPHMEVSQWLEALDLKQYRQIFDKFGGVEDLLNFSEAHIKDLGVKNSAHRARIVSSLVVLKKKYNKCEGKRPENKSQRHSVAVEGGRLTHQNGGAADLVLVSNVIQSKSLCNIKMESNPDENLDQAQLRKALEWELSLDARDLRSHAWYHGAIPRLRAEEIVEQDGDFLIRDCTSQPGNYVLTTRCKGQSLHFVINKVVLQPDTVYERIQYQFEEEAYDTVSDLITYYVGSGKPVSALSGAKIQTPKNRLHPLSFYATKYNLHQKSCCGSSLSFTGSGTLRYSGVNAFKSHSPPRQKNETPPKLPNKQRSLSLTPAELNWKLQALHGADEKSTSADGVIRDSKLNCGTNSLPRGVGKVTAIANGSATVGRSTRMSRVTSDPTLSPCFERRKPGLQGGERPEGETKDPPPKPSRIPSLTPASDVDLRLRENVFSAAVSYQASGSDSGNGSGDSAQSSATGDSMDATTPSGSGNILRGVVIKNPRYRYESSAIPTSASSTTLKAIEYDSSAEDFVLRSLPEKQLSSFYDLENFHTLLLPAMENKPVDASALQCVRTMLIETGSRILANHLTRVDLEITIDRIKDENWEELAFGVSSGLEMCVLPQGQQIRLDIIERAECLKLLVAVTILTCANESERAETLNKWIQVAIDVKTALGNLFGFCSIMLGLCLPQVQRLATTWHVLRQKFTDSAFSYEAKLRPTLKSMNECTNPQAPNTTIPHLLPFVLLQERTVDDVLGQMSSAGKKSASSLTANCLEVFESTMDLGLSTMFAHLETGRKFAGLLPSFRRNAEIVLGDAKVDEMILDMFRTEFHLKFLWGSRGASVGSQERHAKFDQVLTVMSEKCEPSELQICNSSLDVGSLMIQELKSKERINRLESCRQLAVKFLKFE